MDMKFMPAGDEALVVEFGRIIDDGINRQVHALAEYVRNEKIYGVRELLPTFRSLMIFYDNEIISYGKLIRRIKHF